MSHCRVRPPLHDRPRGDRRGIDDDRSELPRVERGAADHRVPRPWLIATLRQLPRSGLLRVTTAPRLEPDPSIQQLPMGSAYTHILASLPLDDGGLGRRSVVILRLTRH